MFLLLQVKVKWPSELIGPDDPGVLQFCDSVIVLLVWRYV